MKYTVVFVDPDGSNTAATMLTIAGISPTAIAPENTSVHLFFQGLVTTPISPGTGVYFTPEPVGFFDVAADLSTRNAVLRYPDDLSVMTTQHDLCEIVHQRENIQLFEHPIKSLAPQHFHSGQGTIPRTPSRSGSTFRIPQSNVIGSAGAGAGNTISSN